MHAGMVVVKALKKSETAYKALILQTRVDKILLTMSSLKIMPPAEFIEKAGMA